MEAVNVRIGLLGFDHAGYDQDCDVLCPRGGPPQPGEGEETPEGRVLPFAPGPRSYVLRHIETCDVLS